MVIKCHWYQVPWKSKSTENKRRVKSFAVMKHALGRNKTPFTKLQPLKKSMNVATLPTDWRVDKAPQCKQIRKIRNRHAELSRKPIAVTNKGTRRKREKISFRLLNPSYSWENKFRIDYQTLLTFLSIVTRTIKLLIMQLKTHFPRNMSNDLLNRRIKY